MREWQLAHAGFARCRSTCSRVVNARPLTGVTSSGGTPAGGGLGGEPSKLDKIHFPRYTGDVLFVCDVGIRINPMPRTPPRGELPGSVTRRNPGPLTFAIP